MAGLVPRSYEDFRGGVNKRDAPIGLAPNELIASENMEPSNGGVWIQGRAGQTNYNATAIDTNAIKSLHRFYRQNVTGILIATSGTKIYKGNDGPGTFTDISDVAFTTGKKFTFAGWSAKDKVYMTNGVEVLRSWDGVAATTAIVGGSPPVASFVEFHQDRLWLLQDNLAYFSDLNVDNVWPGASALNVADSKGGVGKFIKGLGQVLVIGKDSGLFRFQGSPKLGGELRRYSDIPCIAAYTADTSDFGVIFLGPDGIYVTDGFSVEKISPNLNPLFTDLFRTSVGKYWPKKKQYWFSYSTSGGTNDQLWVGTHIKTPEGNAVAWHQYLGFKAECFAVLNGGSDKGELYYGRGDDGKVRKTDTTAQDVGTDYTCKFQIRHEDFGDARVNKQLRWMKAVFDSVKAVTYAVDYSFGEATGGGGAIAARNQSGTLIWGSGNWGEKLWGGPVTSNRRTSVLDLKYGRYLSAAFQNTGDGAAFKFYGLILEARVKDLRAYEPFSLASSA